jgi:hypothetical protein
VLRKILCQAQEPAASRGLSLETIFVMQPTENWRGDDAMSCQDSMTTGLVDKEIRRRIRNARSEARMRTAAIVMRNPPRQHPLAPAGISSDARTDNAVNCVTRSTRSTVPEASQVSALHDIFEGLAIALNVRAKQSATAATVSVSGDHRSPGPSNSAGSADASPGQPFNMTSPLGLVLADTA